MTTLAFAPITIATAKDFVREHHRHNKGLTGAKLAIGLEFDGVLVGVGLLGRPMARELAKDRLTAEAVRVCVSPAAPHGSCSKINARLKRMWQLQGGVRFITYTRADEGGESLRGAGMAPVATVKGRQWNTPSRPRPANEAIDKVRWEQQLTPIPA